MNNQRGFVTLEMIFVVLIIAVLSTIAVPKITRMVDEAQLDYEMKIFLSTLDFAKSLNKNFHYSREIFKDAPLGGVASELQLDIDENLNRYTLTRNNKGVFEPHELPSGFKIRCEAGLKQEISFTSNQQGHITLTSRLGGTRYIIFDSVGRWRGDNKPPQ